MPNGFSIEKEGQNGLGLIKISTEKSAPQNEPEIEIQAQNGQEIRR
jgi:hypothetical protein